MKTPDDRVSDALDRLTNLKHELASEVIQLTKENAELKAEVQSYRSAICFETTCISCAGLLDKLAYAESIIAELKQPTKEDA